MKFYVIGTSHPLKKWIHVVASESSQNPWHNLQEYFTARALSIMSSSLKLWSKKYTLTYFVAFGKRPEKKSRKMKNHCFLLHDNTPAHRSVLVSEFPRKNNVTSLKHPPYYSDLTPADFYLFPRLELASKGRRFCDSTDIKNAMGELKRLSKNGFQEYFQHLWSRWQKHIDERQDYFEENIANMFQLFWFLRNIEPRNILEVPRIFDLKVHISLSKQDGVPRSLSQGSSVCQIAYWNTPRRKCAIIYSRLSKYFIHYKIQWTPVIKCGKSESSLIEWAFFRFK